MQTYLYKNELSLTQFPDLERDPGVYLIEAMIIKAGADKRIPVPDTSPGSILISYTLMASEVAAGSVCRLEIVHTQSDGKQIKTTLELLNRPSQRDNFQPLNRPNLPPPSEGALARAIFWIDLAPLIADKTLHPGDQLIVSYGKANTKLVMPALSPPRKP